MLEERQRQVRLGAQLMRAAAAKGSSSDAHATILREKTYTLDSISPEVKAAAWRTARELLPGIKQARLEAACDDQEPILLTF